MSQRLAAAARRLTAAGIPPEEARIEARLLLLHALGISGEELRLRPDRNMTPEEAARYESLIVRRERREPLAYLTGTRAFYGLDFLVTPAVLIPRPETEFLVEAILRHIASEQGVRCVADVGTGSGCIAVAIAVSAPKARVFGSDVSPDALAVAQRNAERHGVAADRVTFHEGDLLTPLVSHGPFAVIASNPPYIAPEEIAALAPEVHDHEPRLALGTRPDPLHFYRRLAAEAPTHLSPGGLLAVEVGQGQAESVAELWRAAGLRKVETIADYAGIGRVVTGRSRHSAVD